MTRDLVTLRAGTPDVVRDYANLPHVLDIPDLIQVQLNSYGWFVKSGLRELLDEINPIQDFTGSRMDINFRDYWFEDAKFSEAQCRERDATYAAPLKVKVELEIKETGEIKEQNIYLGDFPLMTGDGTFVINGAERVVVSQLVRSPGAYFSLEQDQTTGRQLCHAKLIPNRGAWLEFETSNKRVISVKVDRKRKIPVTTLLRAVDEEDGLDESDLGSRERMMALFEDVDDPEHSYIAATLDRDPVENKQTAIMEFYRRLRPGDPPTLDNARNLLQNLFFNPRRYDLGRVGRHKLSKRLEMEKEIPEAIRTLTRIDMIALVKEIIRVNRGRREEWANLGHTDDIDHLGNRRVRAVGELIQNQFRIGLLRMERVIRERMTITDPDQATPSALINIRPVVAAIKEFFGGSQLSQFMDQTNPLAELTHKRRLSALGPGGLSRDRAGFDVRDVHYSHYGRICPIETPEGPNIGLIGSLATYGRINDYGFIETPYLRVLHEVPAKAKHLVNRIPREEIKHGNKVIAAIGERIDEETAQAIEKGNGRSAIRVRSFVSEDVEYLSADTEDRHVIAQSNSPHDEFGNLLGERIEVRDAEKFIYESPDRIDYMDVSPKQIVSVAASLIPFLEHDDANRALMGANMQRQAVPLLKPEVPLVGTGMEGRAARDSGQVITAKADGEVAEVSARDVTIRYDDGQELTYPILKFMRSNQGTCINQRPIVEKGQRVKRGDALADSSSTDGGELALGQTVLVAFMSWEGYNFEDAIIISRKMAQEDKFTSIHIEKHEVEARDTKLGPEEITRDIPNVGEESLKDLDETGIVRVGAEVQAGDILVGKITPKGETELTAEEKLLRAIFGEKAREVKDTSLRVPHGERGKVIEVKVFNRGDDNDTLGAGVNKMVRVSIAQRRKISEGDKMAGRHGNKGVIATILPMEDMPYLEDGTAVDIILNPIGVPSRMNVGQVLETHLGWAAASLGFRAVTPVFDGASDIQIEDDLSRAWMAMQAGALHYSPEGRTGGLGERVDEAHLRKWIGESGFDPDVVMDRTQVGAARRVTLQIWLEGTGHGDARSLTDEKLEEAVDRVSSEKRLAPPIFGKQTLYDGRTGEPFDQPVTVGYIYMMKLVHLVEDKIHARSTGPYSLITQQPLGGKAQFGGQRFGEMEVWALEAYGASHILQELLTVKSDDVVGRVKTYEAIVKGEDIMEPGVPESFRVLVKELQSLGLAVEVLNEDEERVTFPEDSTEIVTDLGIDLTGFERSDVSL
ncbi:MAG: DNA-directed RNA polymerase subunit beta [Dehalococcoidia bacterium]|nr:DNA-directed RNA polymerase subunit beta [Dehalococcoidia bacterium]